MTNGELIDILSKSPRDKQVALNVRVDLGGGNSARLNFEIGDICEYDEIIEIEQKL